MRSPEERANYRAKCHAYTRSSTWARRAARFRKRHGDRCQACGRRCRIDVHHRSYDRAFTGREPDSDLRGVCRSCHIAIHDLQRNHGVPLAIATDQIIGRTGRHGSRSGAVVLWLLLGAVAVAFGKARGWW